jgi:hypothetical protein
MALSQADFYAYSRATGAPIPEDPMERAQMAPEVLAFRRNQLKAPEKQGADPLSVGLGFGLALAGGVGAVLGARRLMGGRKPAANAGVRQANLSEMAGAESPVRRVVAETQPEPSKTVTAPNALAQLEDIEYESPYRKGPTYQELYPSRFEYPRISSETIQTRRQAAAQSAAAARELGGEVSPTLRQIRSSEFGPNISPVRRDFLGLVQEEAPSRPLSIAPQQLNIFNPRSYLEQKGSLAPIEDLTSVQQQALPQVIDQKLNAVESGANQKKLQTIADVQRNEDVDISFVQQFLQRERDEIASQMGELGLKNPSLIEKELANRLGPESYEYGSQYTKIKQQIELGMQDPRFLQQAQLPETIRVGGGEFPITTKDVMSDEPELTFKKPYISESTAISSEESFTAAQNEIKDWLGNIRVEVEPQINKLSKVQAELGEQQNILLNVLNQQPDPELAKQFQYVTNQLKETNSQIDALNKRLSGAQKYATDTLQDVTKWTPETLTDWSGEGVVVRPKRQAPGEFITDDGDPVSFVENVSKPLVSTITEEDLEIVPGGLLTGGRAKVVENLGIDPFSGEEVLVRTAGKREPTAPSVRGRGGSAGLATESSIGIYGLEPREYGTAAQSKTGEFTAEASQVPSLVTGEPTPRATGGFFKYPQQREADPTKYARVPTQQSQESFDVARQLRQLQLSGKPGEAQVFLDKIMKERGVSSSAGTYSSSTGGPSLRRPSFSSALTRKPTLGEQALNRYVRAVGNPYLID